MKQEVFEGLIDGQKFDDPAKFKEYLEEHKDAKNVSYSHSIREVADEQPKAVEQGEEKACKKCQKKQEVLLQFPEIDIDEFMNDPYAKFEDVENKYNQFLIQHRQMIENLDADELSNLYETLQKLRVSTKEDLKLNAQATHKLNEENNKLEKQIHELQLQVDSNGNKLDTLSIADKLLNLRYQTIKGAIVNLNSYCKEEEKPESRNLLKDLLDSLYSFC